MNRYVLTAATLVFVAGCGAGGGGISVTSVNPGSPSYSSLQFAVGTANIYGSRSGLNVVSTFRQTDGSSATGVNTPKISGPMTVSVHPKPSFGVAISSSGFPDPYTTILNGGPSFREWRGNTIEGTPQTVAPGTPPCDGGGPFPSAGFVRCPSGLKPNTTSFGESGGDFAMGIQPSNAVAATGQAYSYQPYPQPLYGSADPVSHYQFVPWGGPPAFDPDKDGMGTRDGLIIAGVDSFGYPYFLGIPEGVTVFDGVKVRSGVFTLSVAISTIGNGGSVSTSYVNKTAHLDPSRMLPTMNAPVFNFDGKGGGKFSMALPHGVTEAYVQVVDYGPKGGPQDGGSASPSNCQGPRGTHFAPVYYTIELTKAAMTTYRLPDTIGPNLATSGGKNNLKPSPSICTAKQNGKGSQADDIVIQTIGFNYPIYAAALGLVQSTTPQNPHIAGPSGQADITIARAMEQDNGSTSQTPLVVSRR
jgi:hypothetical protein